MKKTATIMMLSLCSLAARSQTEVSSSLDFVDNGITYTIIDPDLKTCQTKSGNSYYQNDPTRLIINYGNETEGPLIIPPTVTRQIEGASEVYTVVAIGDYAFHNITSLYVPSTVKSIGAAAFSASPNLATVIMEQGVETMGPNAFAACPSLVSVTLPESLTSIPKSAFVSCTALADINIPSSVTSIGERAFNYCKSIKSFNLSGVTEFGPYAFAQCTALQSVLLSENITSLPSYVFQGCTSLTSVSLPASISSIGEGAFSGCSNLTEVTCYGTSVPVISWNSFSGSTYAATLKVYKSMASAFSKSPNWSQFATVAYIPVACESITLDKTNLNLNVGLSAQFNATPYPSETSDAIVWSITSSSPENILSINDSGKIIGQRTGTAVVTVTCGLATASCVVNVVPNSYESVTISPLGSPVYVGDKVQMYATVVPSTIISPVVWSSSNTEVATIDENSGMVNAVGVGTALISAKCEGVTGKYSLTVNPIVAQSVALDQESLTLKAGISATLHATVSPANTTYPEITWESSDNSVATVSNGVVTGVGVGACTIRAKCGEVMANCQVTVEITQAESLTLDYNVLTLKPGQSGHLNATVNPSTTTDQTIVWTSSNNSVATVTVDGLVSALAVGNTVITATCGNVSAVCNVSVEPILASEVVLNYTTLNLQLNQVQQLTALVADDVTDKSIIWSTSDEVVATVNNGLVTAVGLGTAEIKATSGSVSATCMVTVSPIPVTGLSLAFSQNYLNVGETLTASLVITPSNATDPQITWESSDTKVATVANGEVTGVAPGSVTITAICGSVVSSYPLNVYQPAKSISLNYESLAVEVGDLEDIIATVEPSNTTDVVVWTSSDNTIVSVNDHGIVQGITPGVATVKAVCGEVEASCEVTVVAIAPEEVTLNISDLTLNVSESQKLTATVSPANATPNTVVWTSSNASVAKVDSNGTVTGVMAGEAVITASCGSVSASCAVKVVSPSPETIVISYSKLELHATETFQLSANLGGVEGKYNFTWISSDSNVATVDNTGLVNALKPGVAVITVSDGKAEATCDVTVVTTEASAVILNNTDLTLNVGEIFTLKASVYPEYTTDGTIVWSSDNEAVAKVDQNGFVTAVASGYSVIKAFCGNVFAQCVVTVNEVSSGGEPGDDNQGGSGDDNQGGEDNPGDDNQGGSGDDNQGGEDNPGDDGNGVEEILNENTVFNVYDINGFKLISNGDKESLKSLQPGLYIINGQKVYIRK